MKVSILLASVAVLVSGCSEPSRQASTLQRLDSLTSILRATSASSTRVADDWSRLAAAVAAANTSVVRRQAGVLLVDASRLSSRAGTSDAHLREFPAVRASSSLTQYVNDLAAALSAQWWEAREVEWTAQLLRRDPLLQEGGDAANLTRLEAMARRSASRAVSDVATSRRIRYHDRRLFRYVPVAPASTKEGIP